MCFYQDFHHFISTQSFHWPRDTREGKDIFSFLVVYLWSLYLIKRKSFINRIKSCYFQKCDQEKVKEVEFCGFQVNRGASD